MTITRKSAEAFESEGFSGHLYVDKKHGKPFNALLIESGEKGHFKMRLKGAARAYFVIEGEGVFVINGEEFATKVHDLIIIEDGDVFEYRGVMTLFEFNVPATAPENEERVE